MKEIYKVCVCLCDLYFIQYRFLPCGEFKHVSLHWTAFSTNTEPLCCHIHINVNNVHTLNHNGETRSHPHWSSAIAHPPSWSLVKLWLLGVNSVLCDQRGWCRTTNTTAQFSEEEEKNLLDWLDSGFVGYSCVISNKHLLVKNKPFCAVWTFWWFEVVFFLVQIFFSEVGSDQKRSKKREYLMYIHQVDTDTKTHESLMNHRVAAGCVNKHEFANKFIIST